MRNQIVVWADGLSRHGYMTGCNNQAILCEKDGVVRLGMLTATTGNLIGGFSGRGKSTNPM